jgi:hypothetical protein
MRRDRIRRSLLLGLVLVIAFYAGGSRGLLLHAFEGSPARFDAAASQRDPSFSSPTSDPTLSSQDGYDVILIAGQSNAVGFGCGPYTPEFTDQDGRIFQIKPDLSIVPAADPLFHRDGSNRVGFGMAFARLYARAFSSDLRKVLIVPVARAATSIIQWDDIDEGIDFSGAGTPFASDTTELWRGMTRRLTHALGAGSGRNRLVAVLWHQGESDYNYINDATSNIHRHMGSTDVYRRHLQSLAEALRRQVPSAAAAPFLIGELPRFWAEVSPHGHPALLARFNAALADAAAEIGLAAVVSSEGLVSGAAFECADRYHFSAMSQTEFGRRFFQAYQGLSRQ